MIRMGEFMAATGCSQVEKKMNEMNDLRHYRIHIWNSKNVPGIPVCKEMFMQQKLIYI